MSTLTVVSQLRDALDSAASCLEARCQRALGQKITEAIDEADKCLGRAPAKRQIDPVGNSFEAVASVRELNPRLTRGIWSARWLPETHCEGGLWLVIYKTASDTRQWDAEPIPGAGWNIQESAS